MPLIASGKFSGSVARDRPGARALALGIAEQEYTTMKECPHCHGIHLDEIEQALCPLRPEQIAVNVEMFGNLAQDTKYSITDHVVFTVGNDVYTGVILWTIAPNETGTHITPEPYTRYVIERDQGSDEWYAVPVEDIISIAL
jgi:hypothetical protein